MTRDEGHPISYKLLERGTLVVSSDDAEVGTVLQVLDNAQEQIFDGIVVRTPAGEQVFVDAPEVGRIAERLVTLTIDADEARRLPPPSQGAGEFRANPKAGRLGRMLGGGWRRR